MPSFTFGWMLREDMRIIFCIGFMALTTASSECKVHEELVREKVKEILAVETQQKRALEIAKNAWDSLPDGPHRRIETIKGIGIQTACALVAKIVTIDRFQSPKALIGYFGCFPEQTTAWPSCFGRSMQFG